MLKDTRVAAMIPTQDLARAKEFYEGKLGFTPEDEPGGVRYRCADGTEFAVFLSSGKTSGTHTQVGFDVRDIDAEASSLAAQGITPDPVDIPGATVENGIVSLPEGVGRGLWFKDPDGNVIAVFQRAAVPATTS
jgi:predicted enzyme related to lactoylglutathione lyase